jgi:hypothetical protein
VFLTLVGFPLLDQAVEDLQVKCALLSTDFLDMQGHSIGFRAPLATLIATSSLTMVLMAESERLPMSVASDEKLPPGLARCLDSWENPQLHAPL